MPFDSPRKMKYMLIENTMIQEITVNFESPVKRMPSAAVPVKLL